jgi:hypothetical protein
MDSNHTTTTTALDSIVYLTGVTNPKVEAALTDASRAHQYGLLTQPDSYGWETVSRWDRWAADNGCFNKGASFVEAEWFGWLTEMAEAAGAEGRAKCLFAVAPDVVGDAEATLARSLPWLEAIRGLGLPAAFVAQDGSEDLEAELIPWGQFDVLFLGGSTEWKLDPERAGKVTAEALRRGVKVHMGRVNSGRRLKLAASWGCHTADGTFLAFGPDQNLPRLLRWRLSAAEARRAATAARKAAEAASWWADLRKYDRAEA